MGDIPIIFSAPMVKALLAGRKTMTRRLLSRENLRIWTGGLDHPGRSVKPSTEMFEAALREASDFRILDNVLVWQAKAFDYQAPSTRTNWQGHVTYQVGQALWVRENLSRGELHSAWKYAADDKLISLDWPDHRIAQMVGWAHHREQDYCPSIHMPRWASRLTLEVTAVKIERLGDISEADAIAEGIEPLKSGRGYYDPRFDHGAVHLGHRFNTAVEAFIALWDSIHGEDAWAEMKDLQVVAPTFTVHQQNIDAFKPTLPHPANTEGRG